MSILQIVKYGNPTLTKKAEEIINLDKYIEELAQNMLQTMYAAPGIGLAAPQVNESKRLITVDLSVGENSQNLIILINPELISQEGKLISEEGCLSVPDINEKVARPFRIIIKGIDLKGNEKTVEAEGLLARVLCHEIDHINGKLFIDHLSLLKKSLIKKKLKKAIKMGKI
jgi:peptide deformylase